MNENNPNERIYLRPSKPLNEMTDEEIRTLAEETYEQIIRTLAEKKNTETKSTNTVSKTVDKTIFSTYEVGTNSDPMLQTLQERCL